MPWHPHQWPKIQAGGIINFGYLILSIERGFEVNERFSLVNESFLSGRVYNRPQIPVYLLDKYPESEWAPFLKKLLEGT